MARDRRRLAALAAAAGLVIAAAAAWAWQGAPRERQPLGLFSSLPLYWNETGSIGETLAQADGPHWVRAQLEQDYQLDPLDTLDARSLARTDRLLLAQPRPLTPPENVALDDWVRGGGRLLLFADPLLTEESRYPLGDKRRPQDVVLLSPILARWGLELTFDDTQPAQERRVSYGGANLAEHLAGRLRQQPGASCTLAAGGLVAECAVGKGKVIVVADAALLEADRRDGAAALAALTERAF